MGDEQFLIDVALDDTCVKFYDGRSSLHRAHLVSRDTVAIIHAFTEYTNGYLRVAAVSRQYDAAAMARCVRARLGVLVPFSCNNIYHQVPPPPPLTSTRTAPGPLPPDRVGEAVGEASS